MIDALIHQITYVLFVAGMAISLFVFGCCWLARRYPALARLFGSWVAQRLLPAQET